MLELSPTKYIYAYCNFKKEEIQNISKAFYDYSIQA